MADIFICYSRKDTERVSQWVERLKAAGYSVWMDVSSVDGATLWAQEIVEAIDACRVFIVMLSSSSADSHHIVKEVSLASEKQKRILPLKLEPVDIPATMQYHLASIHFLELHHTDEEAALAAIVRALEHHGVVPARPVTQVEAAPAAREIKKAPSKRPTGGKPLPKAVWAGLAATVLVVVAVVGIWAATRGGGRESNQPPAPAKVPAAERATAPETPLASADKADGLDDTKLRFAAQTVNIRWKKKGLLGSEEKTLIGSGGVFYAANGRLLLVTSSGSLDLKGFGKSPHILAYEMWITFASGESRVVRRLAERVGGADLAAIEVDAAGLQEGKDYVVLPVRSELKLSEGDEIVVVRSSLDLNTTNNILTFEKITRLGRLGTQTGIYADAALAETNRGGLLFKKHEGLFYWVGVKTFTITEDESQNVSAGVDGFLQAEPQWYECSPAGAAQVLREVHGINARSGN
jgi:hypothetical protein